MIRQMNDGQMPEFLGQPDAAARLAWLEELSTQDSTNTTDSETNREIDNIIELALALKTEATGRMRDKPEEAQQIAALTDEIATWSGNPQIQAISDWTWGNARFFQGHHQNCLKRYQAALQYYEQAEQSAAVIDLHINCANVYTNISEHDQALQYLKRIQESVNAQEDVEVTIAFEMTLALAHLQLDNYHEAVEASNRGIKLATEHDYPIETARLKINLAWAFEELGRFKDAVRSLEEAQRVLESEHEYLEEARAWLNLGLTRARMGEYSQALLNLDLAQRRFENLDNGMNVALVGWYRTQIYLDLNLLPEAIELCKTNQTILQEYDLQYYDVLTDYYAGIAYSRLGELEQARQHLERASSNVQSATLPIQAARIDLARARLIANLPSLEMPPTDQAHKQADDLALQEAESLAQAAYDLFQTHQLSLHQLEAQLVLADIQRQCQNDVNALASAQQNYQAVLDGSDQSSGFHYRAYYGLGQLAELAGVPDEALAWYTQSIDRITDTLLALGENELRGGYLYDKLMIFQAAIALNLAEGHNEQALHLIELARTGAWQLSTVDMELSQNLSPERTQLESELDHLRQQWRWHYQQLYGGALSDLPDDEEATRSDRVAQRKNRHNRELLQIEQTLKQTIRTLRLHDRQNNDNQILADLTLDELRERLEPQYCMLVYYVLNDQVVVFLITLKETISVTLDSSWNDICYDLDKLYFTLNHFDEKADKHLNRLWKRLFAPLMPYLENYTELIIIPHDRLYHLPFHALYDGEKYLLQRYQIRYIPAVTWAVQTPKREWHKPPSTLQSERSTALIMAYSDTNGRKPIPGVLDEAEGIHRAWQNIARENDPLSLKPELYLEEEACATHIYEHAHKGHLFHLAAHGEFRFDNPLFSTLLLGDGPISLADIERLHLTAAPLVALSACETGISNVRGAGVLGISQAFLQAGASMVLVSLWRVEDQATSKLMQAFHDYLTADLAPAQALRQAQVDLIDDPNFFHPAYWAGWTLVG